MMFYSRGEGSTEYLHIFYLILRKVTLHKISVACRICKNVRYIFIGTIPAKGKVRAINI